MTTKQQIRIFASQFYGRVEQARNQFIEYCQGKGFTLDQIQVIIDVYKRAKCLKFNGNTGNFDITHGGFLGKAAMKRALKIGG